MKYLLILTIVSLFSCNEKKHENDIISWRQSMYRYVDSTDLYAGKYWSEFGKSRRISVLSEYHDKVLSFTDSVDYYYYKMYHDKLKKAETFDTSSIEVDTLRGEIVSDTSSYPLTIEDPNATLYYDSSSNSFKRIEDMKDPVKFKLKLRMSKVKKISEISYPINLSTDTCISRPKLFLYEGGVTADKPIISGWLGAILPLLILITALGIAVIVIKFQERKKNKQ